jgi:ethanolamine utilization protein EutQ (cupin superfamily)
MEWELTGESWSDQHTHDEYAYVLEGRLFVECGGVTVEAGPGDVIRVPAQAVGRYWAPDYARIFGIYGPNPLGGSARVLGFEKL